MLLEEELFDQLERQVYAAMPTGPEFALERYSAGSAADPQHRNPNWNRSFELRAEAPAGAVLLLHGLTDSPYTFRALAKTLNERGLHVLGLRMPGHGTAPSGLASVSWRDMASAVVIGMQHLAAQMGDKPIHIVGYSTGAPLAVNYTLDALATEVDRVPSSLILVSPAVSLHRAAALAGFKTPDDRVIFDVNVNYPYLTGSASWYLLTMLTQVFGIKGSLGDLMLEPKLVRQQFNADGRASAVTLFAGRRLRVVYQNPRGLDYGQYRIEELRVDGRPTELRRLRKAVVLPRELIAGLADGAVHRLEVTLAAV